MNTIDDLAALLGSGLASADPEDLDVYSHDCWPISHKQAAQGKHPHRPDAVVRARATSQVVALLEWANTTETPVTPRGLGSSVTGAPLPLHGGIVLDLSELEGTMNINERDLTVTAGASTRGDILEAWLQERGYTLGHSPQSLNRSSVGGWIACRATGQFSSAYGGIEDLVVGFSAVLPTGKTVTFPSHPRAAMGPDLRSVLIGSEGTLGVITEATLKIFPLPEHRLLQGVRFDTVTAGLDAIREITQRGLRPHLIRLYDTDEARQALGDARFDGCALFLGFEGPRTLTESQYDLAMAVCVHAGGQTIGDAPVRSWLDRRYDFSMVESYLDARGGYVETIEIAHSWSRIEPAYREARAALNPIADAVLGHFSHVYDQGTSLYLIVVGNLADDAAAEQRIQDIWSTTMRIAQEHGAALSHHHGVGLARLPYFGDALGSGVRVLEAIKTALDPKNILNPGKLSSERT